MELNTPGYLKNEGVFYPGVVSDIGKSSTILQPLFEAFTNAMEAIKQLKTDPKNEEITVDVFYEPDLFEENKTFQKLVIRDTGIGFNDKEFQRFLTFKDNRKGYHNRGSGRIQYIHSFQTAEFESIFREGDKFKKRSFVLSKMPKFMNEGAIVYLNSSEITNDTHSHTSVTLSNLINNKDKASYNMALTNYKDVIIQHYIQYFCANREELPKIVLNAYVGIEKVDSLEIKKDDIPNVDSFKDFELHYQKEVEGNLQQQPTKEKFKVQAFKIPKNKLQKNELLLTSKGEIVTEKNFKISLSNLSPDDHIEKNRFLFIISSDYIDNRDGDMRGQLRIPRKNNSVELFDEDSIYLDDIEIGANETIVSMYEVFQKKVEEKAQRVSDLKEMFLLNDDFIENIGISINDSEEKILERVYSYEAKLTAKKDAELKQSIDQLENIDPTTSDYDQKLLSIATELSKKIPHQNRAALTHYVARRKLVIELFQKVLDRKLTKQNPSNRNEDERLLHNILFPQRSGAAEESDLWLLNEDFILFKGVSESKLKDVTLNGVRIFKDTFTPEEERFINANGEKRLTKRPDVLLFPAEEKCIILEFKTPKANIADHLNEINYYASLILNLSKPEFPFRTFYGYLIGETLEPLDVKFTDADFQDSAHFNYAFRPAKRILGQFKPFDGSLYTEVLKYSTLLDRARNRNKSLIEKLLPTDQLYKNLNSNMEDVSETK